VRELHIGGRRFPAGLLLAVLSIACALILMRTAQRAVESYQMALQVEAVRKEVGELKQQNIELQERIARYRSDTFVEKVAREELNLVRPGDVPVIVIAPTPQPTAAAAPRPAATPAIPIPRQWLRHFLDEH
jgi:cell division protein DivIC